MIIQATKKLQDFLGIKAMDVLHEVDRVTAWHGNLFMLGRRKCLLLTHDASLYSVFVYGITKKDIPDLFAIVQSRLTELMRRDDFTLSQIGQMRESFEEISYAKTSDRSVMGSMNDMVHMLRFYDMTEDELSLSARINHTPYKVGTYAYPAETLKMILS